MLRLFSVLSWVLLLTGVVSAQTNTLSPYSIYGIGDATSSSITAQAAMGHAGIAVISPSNINPLNPATFPDVVRPSFNFDLRNEILTLSSGSSKQTNNLFSIQNFSFAFPIINEAKKRRRAAMSFGLLPYTRQGYEMTVTESVPDLGDVEYHFFGNGGINSLYLGAGYDLLADSGRVHVLSLGVQGSYVFGEITKNRATTFVSSAAGTNLYRENGLEISGADFNFGLLYKHRITIRKEGEDERAGYLSAGAFYKPSLGLNSYGGVLEYTFSGSHRAPDPIDTLLNNRGRTTTTAPSAFGLGTSLNLYNRWVFALDLVRTEWSKLSIGGVNQGLKDATRISLGMEYIPDHTAYKEFFKTVRYRAGVNFEQTMFNVNGDQPLRYGFACGFGIPLVSSQSGSMFNFGIEYARRQSNATPFTEDFFNIHAGFTLNPNKFDRWFYKRKYD